MPRFVAFLRAINVGGRNLTMDKLRQLFKAAGFDTVETFIASGNVLFVSAWHDVKAVEEKIEKHLRQSLGYEVKTFIRTESAIAAIARYKPFTESRRNSAGALCVGFLADVLGPEEKRALTALRSEIDEFHVHGREVFWLCKRKQSGSKFSNSVFEKKVKRRVTFRGLSTIAKLSTKYRTAA